MELSEQTWQVLNMTLGNLLLNPIIGYLTQFRKLFFTDYITIWQAVSKIMLQKVDQKIHIDEARKTSACFQLA